MCNSHYTIEISAVHDLWCVCISQAVKDWHLVLIVVAMCSVVVVIGIAVAIFGDYKAVQVPDRERPITRNVRVNYRHAPLPFSRKQHCR